MSAWKKGAALGTTLSACPRASLIDLVRRPHPADGHRRSESRGEGTIEYDTHAAGWACGTVWIDVSLTGAEGGVDDMRQAAIEIADAAGCLEGGIIGG